MIFLSPNSPPKTHKEDLNKKEEQAIFWNSSFGVVGHRMVRGQQKEGKGRENAGV